MSMIFFLKPFQGFDADILPADFAYEEDDKPRKVKKKRTVYKIKKRRFNVKAQEIYPKLEARRELEKVVRDKLIKKINNERRERIKRVALLLQSKDEDDLL